MEDKVYIRFRGAELTLPAGTDVEAIVDFLRVLWYNSITKRQETAVLAMGKRFSSMQADAAVFSQLQAENEALKKRTKICAESWSE